MIEAAVLAAALKGQDVERLLDDADRRLFALRIGADATRIDFSDVLADRTEDNLLLQLDNGLRQCSRFLD